MPSLKSDPSPSQPTSEARHTPGPWLPHFEHREGSDQYSFRITDVCESEVVCAKTAWSDTAPTKGDRDRIHANFALIASAPALLAAAEMEELEREFKRYWGSDADAIHDRLCSIARANGWDGQELFADFIPRFRRSAISAARGGVA